MVFPSKWYGYEIVWDGNLYFCPTTSYHSITITQRYDTSTIPYHLPHLLPSHLTHHDKTQGFTWRRSRHLDGMVEKTHFLGGLPSLSMGWDRSPVYGNGMGWKLQCVMGRETSSAGMGWETSGAGTGWYMTRDKNCWDGNGIEWGAT